MLATALDGDYWQTVSEKRSPKPAETIFNLFASPPVSPVKPRTPRKKPEPLSPQKLFHLQKRRQVRFQQRREAATRENELRAQG
jgi:hypothetical protein